MSGTAASRIREVVGAVAPLLGVVCLLQLLLVGGSPMALLRLLFGGALVVVGMALLFVGIDNGIVPMGRYTGAELPRTGSVALIVLVAFAMGLATTLAEPDVLVLATQVASASAGALSSGWLSFIIAAGVGVFTVLALLRVVRGWSMPAVLTVAYGLVVFLTLVAPPGFVPLAYDAGSVTTGVLTAPVVLALAIGLSSVLSGRSALTDGFGLLGLASIGPIILILLLGMLLR